MKNNQKNHKKNNISPTYVYALGGLEEIGKNTYVVEHENDIVIVDCGIKFAPSTLLGVSGMVANYSYLIEKQKNIKALIITHGHEDHIGGIPYLLKQIKIPVIIAPVFAAKLIQKKMSEYKNIALPEFIVFDEKNSVHNLGKIKVDFIRVCHSIPDSFAVYFETPNGTILETGDFRFDLGGKVDETDYEKLSYIGQKGVDVMLCESTSAEVQGFSESEQVVFDNIKKILAQAPGRTFVSTFASNINRIEQVIAMSVNMGKKVVVLGKSMENNIKISRKIGYLTVPESEIISSKELSDYQDHEIVILLTGSQGEQNAALNLLASRKHPKINLKPSDTIILSSNPIPGNFAKVENMVNSLYKIGVNVIENSPGLKIHSSGHATAAEQQLMIKLLKPKFIFPIHGEYKMLRQLQKNAMDIGYEKSQIITTINGHKLALINHKLEPTDIYVDANPLYIDGNDIDTDSSILVEQREKVSNEGILNVVINYKNDKKSSKINVSLVTISTRGCFVAKESFNTIYKLCQTLKDMINDEAYNDPNLSLVQIERLVISYIRQFMWKWRHKNPVVLINFINSDDITELLKQNKYIEIVDNIDTNEKNESTFSDL